MDSGNNMHNLNGYQGYNMGNDGQQTTSPPPTNGNGRAESEGEGAKYSDINNILDQILNITDQSLDEAQVSEYPVIILWFGQGREKPAKSLIVLLPSPMTNFNNSGS